MGGGLTTPGCAEVVNWHINQNIFKINPTQLAVFNNMWVKSSYNKLANQGNNRPVLPLGSRLVHQGSITYNIEDKTKKASMILMVVVCLLCLIATAFSVFAMMKMS